MKYRALTVLSLIAAALLFYALKHRSSGNSNELAALDRAQAELLFVGYTDLVAQGVKTFLPEGKPAVVRVDFAANQPSAEGRGRRVHVVCLCDAKVLAQPDEICACGDE
ncbi:MAG: hypothetical protein PHT12_02875 [Patescibacteria group bacterium]|nr:hypothetical protein [Patescibacteria group bacterium]